MSKVIKSDDERHILLSKIFDACTNLNIIDLEGYVFNEWLGSWIAWQPKITFGFDNRNICKAKSDEYNRKRITIDIAILYCMYCIFIYKCQKYNINCDNCYINCDNCSNCDINTYYILQVNLHITQIEKMQHKY